MTDNTDIYDRFLTCLGFDTEVGNDKITKTPAAMKPKTRVILEMAIENGVKRGYRRAFKYNDSPTEEHILTTIEDCVMSSVYDYFSFEDECQPYEG